MKETSRRTLLSTLAVGLSVVGTGCLAGQSPGTPTESETGQTTRSATSSSEQGTKRLSVGETATSADGVSVTISNPQVRKIIYTPDVGSSAHAYPAGNVDSQFLVFSVEATESDISSLQLAPILDGGRFESEVYRHSFSSRNSGELSLRVPIRTVEKGSIEWSPSSEEQYRWGLPKSTLSAIGSSPQFEVEFAIPDSIPRGDNFTAKVSVTNTGTRDGRFLGVVLDQGPSSVPFVTPFGSAVAVGQTKSEEVTGREIMTEQSQGTAILDWGIDTQTDSFSVSD